MNQSVGKSLEIVTSCFLDARGGSGAVGELDRTGFVRKYNELWSERTGLPVRWVEGAAHNSNADNPAAVNAIIEEALGGN